MGDAVFCNDTIPGKMATKRMGKMEKWELSMEIIFYSRFVTKYYKLGQLILYKFFVSITYSLNYQIRKFRLCFIPKKSKNCGLYIPRNT